jgi:hypothetical protein
MSGLGAALIAALTPHLSGAAARPLNSSMIGCENLRSTDPLPSVTLAQLSHTGEILAQSRPVAPVVGGMRSRVELSRSSPTWAKG